MSWSQGLRHQGEHIEQVEGHSELVEGHSEQVVGHIILVEERIGLVEERIVQLVEERQLVELLVEGQQRLVVVEEGGRLVSQRGSIRLFQRICLEERIQHIFPSKLEECILFGIRRRSSRCSIFHEGFELFV